MSGSIETAPAAPPARRGRHRPAGVAVIARGEPYVWLMGGAMVIGVAMIVGLLGLVLFQGLDTFWPKEMVRVERRDGSAFLGEPWKEESYRLSPSDWAALDPAAHAAVGEDHEAERVQLRTGNYKDSGTHFDWVSRHDIVKESRPEWALILETLEQGRLYGTPKAFLVDGEAAATDPAEIWKRFEDEHPASRERWRKAQVIREDDIGELNHVRNEARLEVRRAELDHGRGSAEWKAAKKRHEEVVAEVIAKTDEFAKEIGKFDRENDRFELLLETASGSEIRAHVYGVVRAYPANQIGFGDKVGIYLSRWGEFLSDDPREANAQGGVYPAIFGTVLMTLIMSLAVVPFGVLAALYLREYAKAGPIVSAVRIAVNNLAGVPSIVFGVFGLGFFCYIVGHRIDLWFFEEYLPDPQFGTGGLMWASLTLALLTLPVVIVTTEEALAAVPSSMREGSYACGASKWQTIRRIVLPRALPGIMTGAILAMARGAGEVAPLMLVGAVKLAPELPLDGHAPFLHPERSFMHLGFHIFDLGFQSQDSEGAKPMVFTTTLLLIAIVAFLNVAAIWMRGRLNRKFQGNQF
ncbi:MAG: phosphate ABC transporter permease PstA [Planctomycetota bacterium]